jgi:cell division protein FtsI/penicillin-binding protein 2
VRRLRASPATPGNAVVLSIDIRLQALVEDLFGDRRGALVALDPRNGEILAFVSNPRSTRTCSSTASTSTTGEPSTSRRTSRS